MKTHKIKIAYILGFVLILSGFLLILIVNSRKNGGVYDMPIQTFYSTNNELNLDTVFADIERIVNEYLPGARYQTMIYSGTCQPEIDTRGQFVYIFIKVDQVFWGLLPPRVIRATATVNLETQMLNITFLDETKYYPSIDVFSPTSDQEFRKILVLAYNYISKDRIPDCNVVVSQLETIWTVRCGSLDNLEQRCSFGINADTFEILDISTNLP